MTLYFLVDNKEIYKIQHKILLKNHRKIFTGEMLF